MPNFEEFQVNIVITGGLGKCGIQADAALREAGHKTVLWDWVPMKRLQGVQVDCTNFGSVMSAMTSVDAMSGLPDAVVHLAGIPGPRYVPDHEVFQNNLMATYNVFSAAARLGIKKVVWASSETLLGLPFKRTKPAYVPMDEQHPIQPEWSYSLSKSLGEKVADAIVQWNPGMSIISLRLSYVVGPDDYDALEENRNDPLLNRFNLWSYIDSRDAGEACKLAVESDLVGHHSMIIAASDTMMDTPSDELLRKHFPEVPVKGTLEPFQSLQSSQLAFEKLGFRPTRSWRTGRP
ncbi:NAD-dependent epimerase/dehydratase family protein [Caballeronia sp. 15711]|uniref:NAD-dependent epimerase/dehydratase family protein n=1 Tax=Caballeronia sp. 15711 TaxID=3391029 RepID=UPI0039E6E113